MEQKRVGKMLNIAICDDDIQTTGEMECLIQRISKQNFVDIETEVFWNGESLVNAIIKENKFDIIYLDIEMEKEDPISKDIMEKLSEVDVDDLSPREAWQMLLDLSAKAKEKK